LLHIKLSERKPCDGDVLLYWCKKQLFCRFLEDFTVPWLSLVLVGIAVVLFIVAFVMKGRG
jgi:hypothetical protein